MPYESEGNILNLRAGESQDIDKGDAIQLETDGDVGVASASSTTILGAALTDVTTTSSDERSPIAVITAGLVDMRSAGAINEGALVKAATGGSIQAHTPAGGSYDVILGRAIEAATGAAETIGVLLK